MPDPRLSILVPNFNNGRDSSRTGTRDFIGDLFQSLAMTEKHLYKASRALENFIDRHKPLVEAVLSAQD